MQLWGRKLKDFRNTVAEELSGDPKSLVLPCVNTRPLCRTITPQTRLKLCYLICGNSIARGLHQTNINTHHQSTWRGGSQCPVNHDWKKDPKIEMCPWQVYCAPILCHWGIWYCRNFMSRSTQLRMQPFWLTPSSHLSQPSVCHIVEWGWNAPELDTGFSSPSAANTNEIFGKHYQPIHKKMIRCPYARRHHLGPSCRVRGEGRESLGTRLYEVLVLWAVLHYFWWIFQTEAALFHSQYMPADGETSGSRGGGGSTYMWLWQLALDVVDYSTAVGV